MLQPILDRVLIRRKKTESKSAIEIPDAYRQAERRGTVVAIGQGVVLGGTWHPLTEFVLAGDDVLFGDYNAEPLDGDPDLVLVRIQDIRGTYHGQE